MAAKPKPKTAPAPSIPSTPDAAMPSEPGPKASAPTLLARAPGPAVRITARHEGVFACGQRHAAEPRDYPAGYFSARQVDEMQAMLLLSVERITSA